MSRTRQQRAATVKPPSAAPPPTPRPWYYLTRGWVVDLTGQRVEAVIVWATPPRRRDDGSWTSDAAPGAWGWYTPAAAAALRVTLPETFLECVRIPGVAADPQLVAFFDRLLGPPLT